ncbi:GWxTD domain-containing protein [Pontibacter lucknowensis]|uniref:GWxTD domain-containing protein n=1 Tax=Pontibacter lucknowensis TaxID=1077936 RepID=A0A1N6TLA8_9BACT|nr:GWxTD domain-containing protein [Pontibacter lucknowensis]SIQ53876.1 GWxTD domain-containing protein [Pontibacter lucknowensis]
MKQISLLTCLSVLLLLSSCGSSDIAYAPMYRDTAPVAPRAEQPEVVLQHGYYSTPDSLHLILRFDELRQLLDLTQAADRVDFTIRSGSTERDMLLLRDTVQVLPQHKVLSNGTLEVPITVPARYVAAGNTMQVRLWMKLAGQERLGISHRLALRPDMLRKDFMLLHVRTNAPVLRGFATTSDSLYLWQHSDTSGTATFTVQQTNYTLQPALPPMSTRAESLPEVPQVTGGAQPLAVLDTFQLDQEGLYLLRTASGATQGLVVQGGTYPLVTRVQDMITPLIYLTTSTEREALYSTQDQKAAVDGFWLKIAKDKKLARELIRAYYTRVETANKLYTSFKPGWATDRGMIYIIYGKPHNVSTSPDAETWIYRESEATPYVKFVFTKKENNFTENHFELVRNREYEENWYSTVARWRAGIINL